MFTKILIANRGEVAVRIIRACQELGIRTVAVYSDADADALHTMLADESLRIGPPPPGQSYLCGDCILEAAQRLGCDALHPGYGFLSENADFAEAVLKAGLAWIGPSPAAMRTMGSKTSARAAMQAAGVPIVPGYQASQDDADLLVAAAEIGFPVLVKATAGGGGKGMRIVDDPAELPAALASARREAQNAFGDDRIYLERLIRSPRHVEFQVFGDQHGNAVHLFERECSVQRRHQKIVEETPSPLLDADLRRRMGDASVAAVRAVGYVNAGTLEFLVDPADRSFYFLEMNTRLQVEHPITEQVTGVDLVKLQIQVAAGEPIPFTQEQVGQRRHAIECRIYAEDPANGFLPSVGKVLRAVEPVGPGVRVDAGVTTGDEVTVHYDPMIAKLIVLGEDRADALRKMDWALGHYVILGLTTNIPFLRAVIGHEIFRRGEATTDFVERYLVDWQPPAGDPPDLVLAAAALSELLEGAAVGSTPVAVGGKAQGDPYSPWQHLGGYRVGSCIMKTEFTYQVGDEIRTVAVEREGDCFQVTVGDNSYQIRAQRPEHGRLNLQVGDRRLRAHVAHDGLRRYVAMAGQTWTLERPQPQQKRRGAVAGGPGAGSLEAAMPGLVLDVLVVEGDEVSQGQPLVLLSAMKMELRIAAPAAGKVAKVHCKAGQVVERGQVLVEISGHG